jgi:hypothetical protein
MAGLTTGLVFGIVAGLAFGIRVGLVAAIMAGLVTGPPSGLTSVPSDPTKAASPATVLGRDDRRAALVLILAVGLVLGLVVGLAFGLVFGLALGLVAWLAFGLAESRRETAWPGYIAALSWLALRHQLPWPLMAFLDDAHQRGVLRQVGSVYQFRHIDLQRRLASHSAQHLLPTSGKPSGAVPHTQAPGSAP